MFTENQLKAICQAFDIRCHDIGDLIDSSRGIDDQRYNYEVNDSYFLKITNNDSITNDYLHDINDLHDNYESIDIYCPRLKKSHSDDFLVEVMKGQTTFKCYMEEKSKLKSRNRSEEIDYDFVKAMLSHLGQLACSYTNKNLSKTKSMWSLIELAPHDLDVDEKQVNFDHLMDALKKHGHDDLVQRLVDMNLKSRHRIKQAMKSLPRCVYQGDLNNSNILVDEKGAFAGLIDFNLAGTEVNVNCFLNESMYYITDQDMENLSGRAVYKKMKTIQEDLLSSITNHYKLNQEEQVICKDYNKVIYSSFWPNVTLMVSLIESNRHIEKVIDYLEELLKEV